MKDYYRVLQITKNASEREIKKSFRLLANQLHPDKNTEPDATQRFIELTEAYEVLSNSTRRQHYDQLLSYEEQKTRINDRKRNRWESEINEASERGKKRGTKYAKDFDYFSNRVIIQTALMLLLEIILGMIVGDISSLLAFSFIVTVGGIIITIVNVGDAGFMILGLSTTIIGGLIFIKQVRKENLNSG